MKYFWLHFSRTPYAEKTNDFIIAAADRKRAIGIFKHNFPVEHQVWINNLPEEAKFNLSEIKIICEWEEAVLGSLSFHSGTMKAMEGSREKLFLTYLQKRNTDPSISLC